MGYFTMRLILACVLLLLCTQTKAIRVIGRDVIVVAGDDAQLFCQLVDTTEPLQSVRWQRRTKEKPTNTDFMVITSDGKERIINGLGDRVKFTGNIPRVKGSVQISNVKVSDEGIYTCIFSVFPSGPYKTEFYLRVLVRNVVSVSTDVIPVAGNTEEILATCTAANAKPAAEVLWSLGSLNNSVKVKTNVTEDSEGIVTVKSSLIGVASKDLNQKKVQCLVSYPGVKEKRELDYTLNIHYPPHLVHIIPVGDQSGTFQCEADANPKPTNFTWSRTFPFKEPVSLRHLIQLTPDSNGIYYCLASNQYGEAVGSFNVHANLYTESTTFWTLLILALFAGVCVFLIWKFRLHQHVLRRLQHDPVPTDMSV